MAALAGLALLLAAVPAAAHLMPANRGTVSIQGTNIYVVQAVPVSALHGFDANGDGLIDQAELGSAYASLHSQVVARIRFEADSGPAVEAATWLTSAAGSDHPDAPIDYIVALTAQRFAAPPETLTLWSDLFGTQPGEQSLQLEASYGEERELVVLTPDRPTHRFFKSDLQTLQSYIQVGVEHIWGGVDHLLFLLAVMAAPMALGRLLLILTGFTLAHAMTITAASLGFVSVPASLVEPLIALSIVGLAVRNFRRKQAAPFWPQFGLVFACGLLHGVGFASALAEFGLNTNQLAATLVGFNLGVELGQFAFVLVAFGLGWAVLEGAKAFKRPLDPALLTQAVSGLAIACGLVFFAQRVAPLLGA